MKLSKPKPKKKYSNDDDFDDFEDDEYSKDIKDKDFDDFNDFDDFGSSFSGQSPIDRHNDLLKDLTNFEPFLKKLTIEWLGLIWNEKEEKYKESKSLKPIMNEIGVSWCINLIRTYARNNNILASLMDDHYRELIDDLIDTVYLNIGLRSKEFGITSNGDIIKVCNQVYGCVVLILSGAGKTSNYRDFLGTTVNRNESIALNNDMNQRNAKTGIIDKSFNWLRGK